MVQIRIDHVKKIWKSVILWFFVFLWMLNILSSSSKTGEISDKQSGYIVDYIQKSIVTIRDRFFIKPISETIRELEANFPLENINRKALDDYVRKTAHIIYYFVLAILLMIAWRRTPLRLHSWRIKMVGKKFLEINKIYFFTWIIALVFSIVDEYYQTFIPGRRGLYTDVIIDHIGILAGLLLIYTIYKEKGKKAVPEDIIAPML